MFLCFGLMVSIQWSLGCFQRHLGGAGEYMRFKGSSGLSGIGSVSPPYSNELAAQTDGNWFIKDKAKVDTKG